MAKEAVFTLKLEAELRDAFVAEASAVDRPASQIVREFMRDFVRTRQEERKHDAWFRAEVEKALKDKRPGIPEEDVERYFAKRRADAMRKAG
ncbi:MAG TPA: type II toxin-antitoxin system RelB/DinJ family antitoxin [Acidobacteriaceae bacterium]|jgi:predicted transcriptional regulator|nr:type II toxin-antitoxin system RelB/DinJ family antitoxin [Acidobacteriaceae bacterium]